MHRRDALWALAAAVATLQPEIAPAQPRASRGPFRIGVVPDLRSEGQRKILSDALAEFGRVGDGTMSTSGPRCTTARTASGP